jgi:hypothetical protein
VFLFEALAGGLRQNAVELARADMPFIPLKIHVDLGYLLHYETSEY